jgi:hypothetical protein
VTKISKKFLDLAIEYQAKSQAIFHEKISKQRFFFQKSDRYHSHGSENLAKISAKFI